MALTRDLAVHTYASASGGVTYRFDVVLDSQGLIAVRNIRGPYGLITDAYTSLPNSVVSDISEARATMRQQLGEVEVTSGTLTFTGEVSQDAVIAGGVLNNTNYRVAYTAADGTSFITTGQTTTGFTCEAPAEYGSVGTPLDVDYVVFVKTQQASDLSGTLTFTVPDAGLVTVPFATAMSSSAYRVVLTPNGFFPVSIYNRKKTQFTAQLGYTLEAGESVTVGYDVFI